MKIKKLDRRYAGYSNGWRYAIQFTKREWRDGKHRPYNEAFKELYGPDATVNPDYDATFVRNYWIKNDNWRCDFSRYRLYVKKESDITLVTLML